MAIVTVAVDAAARGRATSRVRASWCRPIDGRLIKAATFSAGKWAWLAGDDVVICAARSGGTARRPTCSATTPSWSTAAVMDLREAIGLHAPLLDAVVTRWGGALPQYAVGHVDTGRPDPGSRVGRCPDWRSAARRTTVSGSRP